MRNEIEFDRIVAASRIRQTRLELVDTSLIDRVSTAVKTLRQQADEKHWEPDWAEYKKHLDEGEELLRKSDLGGAFRDQTGREVRRVGVSGQDIAPTMIDAGVAREPGSKPPNWCG